MAIYQNLLQFLYFTQAALLFFILVLSLLLPTWISPAHPSQKTDSATELQELSTDEKSALLSEAYTYLYPLVIMDVTKTMQTNAVHASSTAAPINQFIHTSELRNADTKSVVTPNVDTLYSTAWLDKCGYSRRCY